MSSHIFHDGTVRFLFWNEIQQPAAQLKPNQTEFYLCFYAQGEFSLTGGVGGPLRAPPCVKCGSFVTGEQGGSIKSTVVRQLDFQSFKNTPPSCSFPPPTTCF